MLSPAIPAVVIDGLTANSFGKYNTDSLALFGQAVWHVAPSKSVEQSGHW